MRKDENINDAETEIRHYLIMRKRLARIEQDIIEAEHMYYDINSVPFKSKEEAFYLKSTAPPKDTTITRMYKMDEKRREKEYLEQSIKRVEDILMYCGLTQKEWQLLHLRYEKFMTAEEIGEIVSYSHQNVQKLLDNALYKFAIASIQT